MLNRLKSPQFCCHKIFLFPIERNKKFQQAPQPGETPPAVATVREVHEGRSIPEEHLKRIAQEKCAVKAEARELTAEMKQSLPAQTPTPEAAPTVATDQNALDEKIKKKEENQKKLDELRKTENLEQDPKLNLAEKSNNKDYVKEVRPEVINAINAALNDPPIKAMIEKAGLNAKTNVDAMKAALTAIILDYFNKNIDVPDFSGVAGKVLGSFLDGKGTEGAKQALDKEAYKKDIKAKLEAYANTDLLPKIKAFFASIDDLYQQNKDKFKTPLEFLVAFSAFFQLNFLDDRGNLKANALQALLILNPASYKNLIGKFKDGLSLEAENKKLAGEILALKIERQKSTPTEDPKIAIGNLLADQSFDGPIILVPEKPEELEKILKEELEKSVPANIDATKKGEIIAYLTAQALESKPQPGDKLVLKDGGKWERTEAAAEKAAVEAAKKAAEDEAKKTSGETPAGTETGETDVKWPEWVPGWARGLLDSLMKAFKALMAMFGVGGLGAALGAGIEKIAGLSDDDQKKVINLRETEAWKKLPDGEKITDDELKNIGEFVKAMLKKDINMDQIWKSLLIDPAATRQVLKAKGEQNQNWEDFVNERIDGDRVTTLKHKEPLPAAEIAQLFLTKPAKAPEPGKPQPPAGQPPAAPAAPEEPK